MSVRPLVVYPDPRLRAPTQDVLLPTSTQVRELIADMVETMYAHEGIGLAAPQIGVSAKLFVIDLSVMPKTNFVYFNTNSPIAYKPIAFINPTLMISSLDQVTDIEGCLSFPDIQLEVTRSSKVVFRALDEQGLDFEICGQGLLARCMLHEFDHLNGKVFVDHVGHLKRQMITKKLQRR